MSGHSRTRFARNAQAGGGGGAGEGRKKQTRHGWPGAAEPQPKFYRRVAHETHEITPKKTHKPDVLFFVFFRVFRGQLFGGHSKQARSIGKSYAKKTTLKLGSTDTNWVRAHLKNLTCSKQSSGTGILPVFRKWYGLLLPIPVDGVKRRLHASPAPSRLSRHSTPGAGETPALRRSGEATLTGKDARATPGGGRDARATALLTACPEIEMRPCRTRPV
jgi:hypothetical protein